MASLKGLILCGGKSSRMKQDKTEVVYQNRPLLSYAVELFEKMELDFFLSINQNQHSLSQIYQCIEDEYAEIGPIGGIVSAMKSLKSDLLVIPVDMPHLDPTLLEALVGKTSIHELVKCFELNGKIEPFPSIWHLQSIARLELFIAEKQLSIQRCISQLPHQLITTQETNAFRNLNFPENLNE